MFKYSEQYVPIGAKEDAYISQKNQILKEEFSRFISGSDLIRIKSKILELLDADLLKFYPSPKNLYATVCNMAEDVDYDICQHILGVHNFMSYGKTLEEKNALLKNASYENKLIEEVLLNIKLREFGSANFKNKNFFKEENLNYRTLTYDVYVFCQLLLKNIEQTEQEAIKLFASKIFSNCLSMLSLIEVGDIDNAYGLLRNCLETYIELSVFCEIKNAPEVFSEFYSLHKIELDKNYLGKEYPDLFLKKFAARKLKQNEDKEYDYVHYGWVDKIADYYEVLFDHHHPYSSKGLIYYLQNKNRSSNIYALKDWYNKCSGFVHSSIIKRGAKPELMALNLTNALAFVVLNTFEKARNVLKINPIINGIDVYKKLSADYAAK
ncbi:MAG: hypothetical protein IJT25_01045 [Clostridia bacterium]|nr:hypothetical protein [Clostridia bacterium]